ncbi:MAG: hypothetical protein NC102_10770, partial [Clostridium sp.]|nr:hypothetical protein [Clostridium sp.]
APAGGYDLWVHAASLGEFEQARPLIERLKRERPQMSILLTFYSPSGYEVRKNYAMADTVAYLPFDTPGRVRAFLNAAKPKKAIFVKYEFWGNFLGQLHKRGVPTYIIDAIFRPGQIFFRPWGGPMRGILHKFTHLFVQDETSKKLLGSIGLDNVTVAGDTRFDRVTDIMRSTVEFPLIENWKKGKKMLIVGSSWGPDEAFYVPYINSHPDLLTVIAPHEFNEHRLTKLQASLTAPSILFSQAEKEGRIPEGTRSVIIDSFGKLSSLYRYGDMALIGGGFGTGIHNINEAAVYGMPVIFGPKHYKFKEAADLIACGGGYEYTDLESLSAILDKFTSDHDALEKAGRAAGAYIKKSLGSTDLIYSRLFAQE